MRRRLMVCAAGGLILAAAGTYTALRPTAEEPRPVAARPPEPAPPPEQAPPPGLPIVAWGPRDLFPVIRHPRFVAAEAGDGLLAPDEPVLGLVVRGEARAYSTNQLNDHEMVIDQVGGTPVLVTY